MESAINDYIFMIICYHCNQIQSDQVDKLMANLVVRNIDESVVKALKERAGRYGHSAEAEHRLILANALLKPKKMTFAEVLAAMPDVGEDGDFERVQDAAENSVSN